MAFVIDHTLRIDAPAEVVWQVIVDFAHYPEWNPFVVACQSTLVPGESIDMRVRLLGRFARSQREIIFEHQPGRHMSYGLTPDKLGALASRRSHDVEPLEPAVTFYRSHFELTGWFAPVVRRLLEARLRAGFGAMSEGLRLRAEALAAGP